MRKIAGLLVPLLALAFVPAGVAQDTRLTGRWEGIIVLVAAEQEVDITADFSQAGGQLKGQIWFPITGDGAHEVEGLQVEGPRVSFTVHDANGLVTAFAGALSPDGASLQGTMKESGRDIPFSLHRVLAHEPAREVAVARLGSDGADLKKTFNADAGNVRVILLLDPRSFASRITVRLVERYVMDRLNDPNLRVYAIWMAPDKPGAAKAIQHLASLAPDPRMAHFWSTEPSFAKTFEPVLAMYAPITRPCMVFGRDRSWAELPPLPDAVRTTPDMTAKDPLAPSRRLNGNDLAADVTRLLAERKGAQGSLPERSGSSGGSQR